MSERAFRNQDSYEAEEVTRNMLKDFLVARGFKGVVDERKIHGKSTSQVLRAISPLGHKVGYRVRLCWHRGGEQPTKSTHSAAQLLSTIQNGDWVGSLQQKVLRDGEHGATHYLLVQREAEQISLAASIPLSELVPVWCAQRDRSQALIDQGRLGRKTKNHAMNGSSPTIYLRDDKAPEVAESLWAHSGVQNLADLPIQRDPEPQQLGLDDTFEDISYSNLGSDSPSIGKQTRSYVQRDPLVRAAVINRANGKCEREGCVVERPYQGFLDVHHILGAAKSDRVWNCVALCPNCHREAHVAPDKDGINQSLLVLAEQYRK